MNQVVLIGRTTVDPELKFFQTGTAVARFSIAIDRSYKKDNKPVTDFIPVEAWGKKAEYCGNYVNKGELVAIEGSLHYDRWTDQNTNETKSFAKVLIKSIKRLSFKNSSPVPNNPDEAAAHFQEVLDDDEIPF
ncbi:MAG: single-stranded DNA-binding protein [Intestinibacter sp.]|uniref:single-stranded DNA-binding protein n=1 Tax=Intestinibacter sp. TaxID=1965304 RepID=UPI003F13AF12